MRLAIVAMLGIGCLAPPELERDATFAELGPIELHVWIGSHSLSIDVAHRAASDTCPVLGTDFRGDIGGVALSTYPGGVVEHCYSPTTSQPCMPAPSTCDMPWLGFGDLPPPPGAPLTIEDASRIVRCELGDALVPRTVTRVPAGSWDASPGEAVTIRWSPAADLARLELRIGVNEGYAPAPIIPYTTAGDLITFEVPRHLAARPHTFFFAARTDVPLMTKGCGEVPNLRVYAYVVEQTLMISSE